MDSSKNWPRALTWPSTALDGSSNADSLLWYQCLGHHHPLVSPHAQPQTTTEELAVSEALDLDQHSSAASTHSCSKGKEMFQQHELALQRGRKSEWLQLIASSSRDLHLIRHMSDHYHFDWTAARSAITAAYPWKHRCVFQRPFPPHSCLQFCHENVSFFNSSLIPNLLLRSPRFENTLKQNSSSEKQNTALIVRENEKVPWHFHRSLVLISQKRQRDVN